MLWLWCRCPPGVETLIHRSLIGVRVHRKQYEIHQQSPAGTTSPAPPARSELHWAKHHLHAAPHLSLSFFFPERARAPCTGADLDQIQGGCVLSRGCTDIYEMLVQIWWKFESLWCLLILRGYSRTDNEQHSSAIAMHVSIIKFLLYKEEQQENLLVAAYSEFTLISVSLLKLKFALSFYCNI